MKPGTLIAGKYRLRKTLGDGAMGVVWAAVNELVDGEVALKLLQSKNPELRRRLLREAKACGRLTHPNIVKIYDVGETSEGDPFLVMELLKGETLAERLRREQKFPPATAVGITIDVARALRVAHEAGVIHRDLKPANIFLYRESDDDTGNTIKIKVLDFGVSKLAIENESTATVSGTLLGSPAYMSPEQAQALPIDGRADLWSLGVVLFEMLAGVRPFQSRSMTGVLAELLSKPIPRVESMAPGIDPHLGDVVARCLERDLDLRIKDAEELITRLRPFTSARDDLHSSWENVPVPAVFIPPPAVAQPPRPVVMSAEARTVMTPAKEEDGEEYEPTSLYQKPGEAGAAGDPPASTRAVSESQRPTVALPPPLVGAETQPPPIPAAPRLPEGIGAALGGIAGPLRAPSLADFGAPPSAPVFGAPPATTSTLSTTPVSHGPPARLPLGESIPPPFRRLKLDGIAPLIAIGASLGIAVAVVVVLTSSGSSNHEVIETTTMTSSSAIQSPAVSALPAPPVPPPTVVESAEPAPPPPTSTASVSTPPKPPPAPVRRSPAPAPAPAPAPTPTTKKPYSPTRP